MVPDFLSLPEEVQIHIFRFLIFSDRLTASLVCKKWLHTMNCYKLFCDIQIQFSEKNIEAVKLFSRMTRHFECFSFRGMFIGDSEVEFLKKYSRQFIMLSFSFCKLGDKNRESKFRKILHCDNLKTLDVKYSDVVALFASLPNVVTLKLHSSSGLSDYVITELNKSLFKLKVLSLGISVTCEEVSKKFYIKGDIKSNASHLVLSFASIKMLIEKNRTTLRYIDFFSSHLSPEAFLTISEIKGLKLRSILFPLDLHSRYMKLFCENQISLTSLDLTFLLYDPNGTVRAICKRLPNLQELVINYNHAIDNCIIEIFQLQQLTKLDLSLSDKISDLSYREAVSNLKTFKLKHLNLAFSGISDESLYELLKLNRNIRYLNVTCTSISNKTLNMICKNLTLLDSLILDSCRAISDSGLIGEFEIDLDFSTPMPLSNLKYLTELNLNQNPLITNNGCIKAIKFAKLKKLFLEECKGLIIDSNFEIQLKKQNPSLLDFKT